MSFRHHFLLYYLFPMNGHINIPPTPSLNSNKPSLMSKPPSFIPMTTPHQPKQIKSHWYYVFWSTATVSVVLGQIYVALSYRELARVLQLSLLS